MIRMAAVHQPIPHGGPDQPLKLRPRSLLCKPDKALEPRIRHVLAHLSKNIRSNQCPRFGSWRRKNNDTFKAAPNYAIKQLGMIGGRDEKTCTWPTLKFQKQHV